ncbi:hypothetical protein CEP52_012990 [Fusarium oligoseptatum]|uniref:Uncharacterized protein n=1 Tax=Fusarium oligoseptatum TaxID=2604345 RepID=A0A428SW17_9HYPO|nr:hypothetical protein CEP52_012990 [Fusarium oligoseptatum]
MESTQNNAKETTTAQGHAESDDHETLVSDWFDRRFGPEEDERDGFKEWSRQDALKALRIEFWMCHPERDETDTPYNNPNFTVDADHPEYYMYTRLETLIHAHYDEIYDKIEAGTVQDAQNDDSDDEVGGWTGTETSLIRKTVDQLKDAAAAYRAGGYKKIDGRDAHYKELLPSHEEVMLCRFVDPYGMGHGTISHLIGFLRVGWMFSI